MKFSDFMLFVFPASASATKSTLYQVLMCWLDNAWLSIGILPFSLKVIFPVFAFFYAPPSHEKHSPSET
jgi:hypothetical protein